MSKRLSILTIALFSLCGLSLAAYVKNSLSKDASPQNDLPAVAADATPVAASGSTCCGMDTSTGADATGPVAATGSTCCGGGTTTSFDVPSLVAANGSTCCGAAHPRRRRDEPSRRCRVNLLWHGRTHGRRREEPRRRCRVNRQGADREAEDLPGDRCTVGVDGQSREGRRQGSHRLPLLRRLQGEVPGRHRYVSEEARREKVGPVPKKLHRGAPSVILSAAKNLPNLPRSFASLRMTRQNSRVAKLLERAISPARK